MNDTVIRVDTSGVGPGYLVMARYHRHVFDSFDVYAGASYSRWFTLSQPFTNAFIDVDAHRWFMPLVWLKDDDSRAHPCHHPELVEFLRKWLDDAGYNLAQLLP